MRPSIVLAILPLSLLGCRSPDKGGDEGEIGFEPTVDEDGDGWTLADDCDDTDPAVNPGEVELCDDIDNDCDGETDEGVTTPFYADGDADGYGGETSVDACEPPPGHVELTGDCDDADSTTYPDAAERCDGVDNDCDGDIDEAVQNTWYADADADGYGDADSPLDSCDPPEGYTDDATDCDDTTDLSHPGAEELCDGADNDCNTLVDDDATDATTWYLDADSDTYGDAETAEENCDALVGYVSDDSDCDDARDDVYPGADELCDGDDNDCDETVDENAIDTTTWYVDVDGDGYGSDSYTVDACDRPSGFTDADEDCDDSDADINPDATEVCDGDDNDCDGTADEDDASDADTWYADADGDGYGDPDSTTTACSEPSGHTSDDSDCDDTEATAYPGSTETETPGDGIDQDCDGQDLCTDLSCDGIPDLLVGNHYTGSSYSSDNQLFYGDGSDFDATEDVAIDGVGTWSTQVADMDNDGYQDILLVNYYNGSTRYLDSYLYWGTASGYSSSDREDISTYGALVADVADYDGDGTQDIAFAQWYQSGYSTSSYVYYGASRGYSTGNRESLTTYGAYDVESADLDQDGYLDLVFCNYYNDSSTMIDSYIYYGTVSGFSGSSATGLPTEGCRDVEIEDLDGDGYDDLVFAGFYDTTAGSYSVSSFVYYGASTGFSETNRDELGTTGSLSLAVGDYDGDGTSDLAFGSYRSASSWSNTSYVYYGSSTGFSSSDASSFTGVGTRQIESADLDNDGYDDLILTNYYSGSSYSTSSYVYYGSSTGIEATPASLDTVGASRVAIGDLDGDGLPELVFNNYYSGSWSTLTDTYVYWNQSGTFTESNRTDLESYGSWPDVVLVGDTDW